MKEIAAYDYTDRFGETLYQVVRFEPKEFRVRSPDGNGGWVYGLQGIKRIPYRLHDMHGASSVSENPDTLRISLSEDAFFRFFFLGG